MELKEFLLLIKHKFQTIVLIMVAATILVAGVSLLFPLRYAAESRLLITQDTGVADAYTVSRSNEYLGNLFAQVARSSSFFDLVMSSQYNVDQSYFQGNYEQKIKTWRETVQTQTLSDSGIIEISVYHTNPYQAQQIALAVNDVLINKNFNYQGNGDKVKINVIDQPLVSSYPVKPNIIQNIALALVFGFIFSLFYIYILPEDQYSWRLFGSRKHRIRQQRKEIVITPAIQNIPYRNMSQGEIARSTIPTNQMPRPTAPVNLSWVPMNQQPENKPLQGNINNILR